MWLGGQTESFQNVQGAIVYDVLIFQKSRWGKGSPRGGAMPPPPKCNAEIMWDSERTLLGQSNVMLLKKLFVFLCITLCHVTTSLESYLN